MADVFKELTRKMGDFLKKMENIKKGFQTLPKRFQYIQKGFGEAGNGIGTMFNNIGGSFKLGSLSINKLFEAIGDFLEFNANCFAYFMQNMDTCFIFYLVDFIARVLYLIIPAFIYMLRITTGINIETQVNNAFKLIRYMDNQLHGFTGFYLTRYPNSVRNKCYKCHYGGKVQTINDGVNKIKHRAKMVDYTFSEKRGEGNDTIPRLMKKMNKSFSNSKKYFAAAFSASGKLPEEKKTVEEEAPPAPTIDETEKLGNLNIDDINDSLGNIMDKATEEETANATASTAQETDNTNVEENWT